VDSSNELSEYIDEFLSQLNSPSNTLKAYKSDLQRLCQSYESLSKLNQEANLRDIRIQLLEQYTPKTASRRWSVLREFLRFCQLAGYCHENKILTLKIKPDNSPRKIRQALTPELLETICQYPSNIRDRAILWFFYSTGVRVSEFLQYGQLKNLNLATGEFQLPSRLTFLTTPARQHLKDYLNDRKQKKHKLSLTEAIFVSEKGETLSEGILYNLFSQTARKLGLRAKLTDLRDSLALRLLSVGASPEEVTYLLGFKSVKSIEPFLNHSAQDLA